MDNILHCPAHQKLISWTISFIVQLNQRLNIVDLRTSLNKNVKIYFTDNLSLSNSPENSTSSAMDEPHLHAPVRAGEQINCMPSKGQVSSFNCMPSYGLVSSVNSMPSYGLVSSFNCMPSYGLVSSFNSMPSFGACEYLQYHARLWGVAYD